MSSTTPQDPWGLPELTRARRAIVVVDVVESVRLMQEDEAGFIERWRRFVHQVRTEVLPKHGGRLVKSLGDGMLLEFETVPKAVAAALLAQRALRSAERSDPQDRQRLPACRIGVHLSEVSADSLDIYGAGVNLSARIAGLAQPNEIVASPEARAELLDDWDAEIEDLGEFWVKHIETPQRVYRIGTPGSRHSADSILPSETSRPAIAVAPFSSTASEPRDASMGEVLSDDLTAALARSGGLHVISRLSSRALHGREATPHDWASHVGASFVLSGHCVVRGRQLRVSAELADTSDEAVIWADSFRGTIDAVFAGDDVMLDDIVAQVGQAVLARRLEREQQMALPTLDSYSLLLHGIGCMHRTSPSDEERARGALTHLIDRHPRAPEPRAWMAKWHVLRVAQARTSDPLVEARHARAFVAPALDLSPDHSLSLTMDGLVHAFIERDLETAGRRYQEALSRNPNESLAWLYMSAIHAHHGDGEQATRCCQRARQLSPLDPLGYYYNGFAAWAALAARRYEEALTLAKRSMRGNRMHLPTHILLTQAHALCGQIDAAKASAQQLLALRPQMSAARYFEQFPGGPNEHARLLADALRIAGIPN